MYWLEQVSLHNWYLIEARDIPISGATALIGQTGVGKSALIDAIQTAMSGNNHNVIHLNSAAGEARDRRVLDYCLGCVVDLDDGAPRRRRPETIVALSFRDQATGHSVSVGLLLAADAEEGRNEDTRHRFVLRDHAFSIADFIKTETDGREFVPNHETLLAEMKQRFGKALTLHSTTQGFVAEYLAAMRPRSPPDARRFQRSFANAVNAREIRNPTDFVRRFVLEANPLNVQRVRESIATWRELEQEAKRLDDMLRAARSVRSRFAAWARHKAAADTAAFLVCHAQHLRLEHEIRRDAADRAAWNAKRVEAAAQAKDIGSEIERLRDENERDQALAAQSAEAVRRSILEAQRTAQQVRLREASRALDTMAQPYARAVQFAQIVQHLPFSLHQAVKAAVAFAGIVSVAPREQWGRRAGELAGLAVEVRTLTRAADSLSRQTDALSRELADIQRELTELDARLGSAGDSGPLLSSATIEFRAELTRRGISVVALPDVVDVPDARWAFALEALLGPFREALIVPREQVESAFDMLWRNRNRFHTCRLINTRKTRDMRARLPEGSIAATAITDDADARNFIDSHVGRFVRAEDQFDLERREHGVMPNGKTSSGLGLRVYRDLTPILGLTAQAAALEQARQRHAELRADHASKAATEKLLRTAMMILGLLAEAKDPTEIEASARDFADAVARLTAIENEIAAARHADPSGLAGKIAARRTRMGELTREQEAARQTENDAIGRIGGLTTRITERTGSAAQLTQRESELATAQLAEREQRLIAVAEVKTTILTERERVENLLGLDWAGREIAQLQRFMAEVTDAEREERRQLDEARRRANGEWTTYLTTWEHRNPLPEAADEADKLFWIDERANRLEQHELLPHRQRVTQARDEMELMLKEDLLARLSERLQTVRVQLDTLNRRLRGYPFVGQIYSFRHRQNERLKPLRDLAAQVGDNPQLDFLNLQATATASGTRLGFEQIERLVSTDEDTREIADYRNYFEFELEIQDEQRRGKPVDFSSVVGKLSGGQRQAPYYVAIAASMVSVYYPGGRPGEGMGLVVFDEAFNKLDVKNTQALVALFRSLGLQLLIAVPEVNRPTYLETMDTIVNVARHPNTDNVYIDSETIRDRTRQEMRERNPEHLGVEGFRAMLPA